MTNMIRASVVIFLALTLVTGVAYPLLVTAIGQVAFPDQANGSLIERDGVVVGSALIGQSFDDPRYLWGRPSAAGYNGGASTGSNLGPTNPARFDAASERVATLKAAHGDEMAVPIDLVTASGSGLDPHISPAAAAYQTSRIARARGISVQQVEAAIADHTEGRTFGVLGEPRVNVLLLNLALDAL